MFICELLKFKKYYYRFLGRTFPVEIVGGTLLRPCEFSFSRVALPLPVLVVYVRPLLSIDSLAARVRLRGSEVLSQLLRDDRWLVYHDLQL